MKQKNILDFPLSFGFEDISITQNKNISTSRLAVNISSEFVRGVSLEVPLIASNMSTVVDSNFCIKLRKLGALGIMHRAASEDFILKEIKLISGECDIVAASIGIDSNQFNFAQKLITAGANIIVIDIAHGFSDSVINLGKQIKNYSKSVKIILGNTINTRLLSETCEWVDAIKIGIAQGSVCETKNTAGCTEKQFSAIFKFKELSKQLGVPVISDGAIKEPADFVKAIAAGANSVMAGKIFARCPESAAEEFESRPGVFKKIYAGMASRYVQEKWKGKLKPGICPEGKIEYLDYGESVDKLLERYSGALRSGITYGGGNDVLSFQENVEFVRFK